MKSIGLIGGMSWESTVFYYRLVNESIKQHLGDSTLRKWSSTAFTISTEAFGGRFRMSLTQMSPGTNSSNFDICLRPIPVPGYDKRWTGRLDHVQRIGTS